MKTKTDSKTGVVAGDAELNKITEGSAYPIRLPEEFSSSVDTGDNGIVRYDDLVTNKLCHRWVMRAARHDLEVLIRDYGRLPEFVVMLDDAAKKLAARQDPRPPKKRRQPDNATVVDARLTGKTVYQLKRENDVKP